MFLNTWVCFRAEILLCCLIKPQTITQVSFLFHFFAHLAWGRKMWQTVGITKNLHGYWWVWLLVAFFFCPLACGYFDRVSTEVKMHTLEMIPICITQIYIPSHLCLTVTQHISDTLFFPLVSPRLPKVWKGKITLVLVGMIHVILLKTLQ